MPRAIITSSEVRVLLSNLENTKHVLHVFEGYLPYDSPKDPVPDSSEIVSCDEGKNLLVGIALLVFCCGITIGFDCGKYLK